MLNQTEHHPPVSGPSSLLYCLWSEAGKPANVSLWWITSMHGIGCNYLVCNYSTILISNLAYLQTLSLNGWNSVMVAGLLFKYLGICHATVWRTACFSISINILSSTAQISNCWFNWLTHTNRFSSLNSSLLRCSMTVVKYKCASGCNEWWTFSNTVSVYFKYFLHVL